MTPRHAVFLAAALGVAGCGNTYVVPNGELSPAEAGAGPILELGDDIVVSGGSDWQIEGRRDARCIIRGNGHSIRSAVTGWTGHLSIRSCDITGLGTADTPGINLNMHDAASAVIDDCTFDASGQVHVINYEESTFDFSHNTVRSTSLVPAVAVIADSEPAFFAQGGDGTGKKRFSGNLILKSYADFRASNWTIGGDAAVDGNRLIGLRAGFFVEGPGIVLRGNYVHTIFPTSPDLPNGQEVAPFTLNQRWDDMLVEHNVFRHGHWVMRGVSGEVRYNAIIDADDSDWIRNPQQGSKIHHNVFTNYLVPGEETSPDPNPSVQGGIEVIANVTSGVQIWANTFDGGGAAKYFYGPAISVANGSALDSARSNLFMRFAHRNAATIGPTAGDSNAAPLLRYADYNLFYNPSAQVADNYALAVANKVERQDPGFGANDVPPLGVANAQVDPQIAGPLAARFPWTDEQIVAGAITISDMLTYFRTVYAPRAGSPLIDTGDPQDGSGADIGAIGAGNANPDDRFGQLSGTSTPADAGSVPARRHASDGPLTLRCSIGSLGCSRPPPGAWLVLGIASLQLRRRRRGGVRRLTRS
jgi:hypothetical protein